MADKSVNIPLGQSKWHRVVSQSPDVQVKNRYFETNPANQVDQVSFLSRPGLRPWQVVGTGPIRTTYSQPGTFDESLFVISGDELYQIDALTAAVTFISDDILPGTGKVAMAAAGSVNGTPDYLYIADGRNLFLYTDNGYATGVLTGTPANNDVISLGVLCYKWTSGSVNVGTPDGTVGNPFLVALGAGASAAFLNMYDAILNDGIAGTQYSSTVTLNTLAEATFSSSTQLTVQAIATGILGNSVPTTETGAALSWTNGASLTGGGDPSFTTVVTPDDVGISDVCYTSEFIIAVASQGQGINGRFYWIEPGATTIDPLNFATAERAPDPIVQCIAVGDQFWLLGTSSTEVWFPTGDETAPFQRVQGRLFDKGTFSGTAVAIKDSVVVCSRDGRVYDVTSSPQTISTPAIEEQIRAAIRLAESRGIL